MKIDEFIKLSFFEASKVLKKALGNKRINGSIKIEDFEKSLNLSDAVWGEITSTGSNNSSIRLRDKWSVVRSRLILSFRYNKNIKINYYIGNTNESCTLKEITYSGIDIYWSNSYSFLSDIGISPDINYIIPEIPYGNGRKGTVQDFLNKKWGLTKVNIDLALAEADRILTDGSFLEAWSSVEDYKNPFRQTSRSLMIGRFGELLVKILTNNTRVSLKQTVLLMKIGCGMFREYPIARDIDALFIDGDRQLSEIKPELEKLEREIERHLDLDTRMTELTGMVLTEYEKTLSTYVQMNPDLGLTVNEIKRIIDLQTDVNVQYKFLKIS